MSPTIETRKNKQTMTDDTLTTKQSNISLLPNKFITMLDRIHNTIIIQQTGQNMKKRPSRQAATRQHK